MLHIGIPGSNGSVLQTCLMIEYGLRRWLGWGTGTGTGKRTETETGKRTGTGIGTGTPNAEHQKKPKKTPKKHIIGWNRLELVRGWNMLEFGIFCYNWLY